MKLFFNHLPKNGGESVHHILSSVLGPLYANLNTNGFQQINGQTTVDGLTAYTRSPNLLALGSHVTSPKEEVRLELLETCPGIAIVRSPEARIVSLYNYAKKSPHLAYHQAANDGGIDYFFNALYDSRINFTYPAQRAQIMYEREVHKSGTNPDAESLAAVQHFLSHHYLLVGVTERMDLFYEKLQILLQRLFRQPGLSFDQAHTNRADRSGTDALSDANAERLTERAHSDMTMHEWLLNQGVFFNEHLLEDITMQLS